MWIVAWNLMLFSLLTSTYSQLRIVLKMLTAKKAWNFKWQFTLIMTEENKIGLILTSQGNVIRILDKSNFSEAWLFTWCLFCTVWSLLSMAVFYCIARDKKSLVLIIHEFAITASTTVTKFMVEKFNSMHLLLAVLAWFWIRFYESNLVVINCRKLIEITAVPHEFLHREGSFRKLRIRPNNFISLNCDTVKVV